MSLAARSTADERMDTDCVDYDDYRRCLRDLARVNTVTLTYWKIVDGPRTARTFTWQFDVV